MVDAPSRPRTSRAVVVALVLSGASLLLSLVSLGLVLVLVVAADFDPLPVQSEPGSATAAQVEAVAHVTLPPGTVFLAAAYTYGLDTRLAARFRIPATSLDAFLGSGGFTAPLTPGLRAVDASHNVGGGNLWHPELPKAVSGLVEEEPTADGTLRSLMLDLDDKDTITVYLFAGRD
jgi:hypothetical protein